MKKRLKCCAEFSDNPFTEGGKLVDISSTILSLSKTALELIYYILEMKYFLKDKFLFDINDFKNFTNKRSEASTIQALGELCSIGIIARTKIARVYWVNKQIFVNEKEMEFVRNFFMYKKNI